MSVFPTRAEVHADARDRAARTFWQGLVVAAVLAAVGVLAAALVGITPDQMFSGPFWVGIGVLALQAVATAVGSYLQRAIDGRHAE